MEHFTLASLGLDADGSWTLLLKAFLIVGATIVVNTISRRLRPRDPRLPPLLTKYGALEFITQYITSKGPQFALKVARELQKENGGKQVPVYHAPGLWILGIIPPAFQPYIVNNYRLARLILENPRCEKPIRAYKFFHLVAGGDTFFSANGHRAMHARKAVSGAFKPTCIKRMAKIIERVLEEWIDSKLGSPAELDITEEMMLITTAIIAEAGFNYDLSDEERQAFNRDMEIAMKEFFLVVNPLRKMKGIQYMFQGVRRAKRATKRLIGFCLKVLENFRGLSPEQAELASDTIVAMIANNPEYNDDGERARDIIAFFFAGFETTSASLGWTLLELSRHPGEQLAMRNALKGCQSPDEMYNCQALKNVIRESLRLHSPAALGSSRELASEIAVPGTSQVLPAGSVCFIPYYVVSRDESVYKDADNFAPSRWNEPSDESMRAFMAFAVGRRNCVGMALAQVEMNVVLAQLCSRFEFQCVEEGESYYFVTIKTLGAKLAIKPL